MRLAPLCLGLLVAGCDAPRSLEPTAALVVTLDGQPAGGLNVRLVGPDGASAGGGATGADGRAVVRCPEDKGVPPGTYKVVVTDAGGDEPDPMAPAAKKVKSRVPASYAKPATTPLSVTVEAGKPDYPVEVKSKS